MQLATEMALASEGGSMGTWQKGLELALGQHGRLVPALCSGLSDQWSNGMRREFLASSEGAQGFGEVQGLLRSHC